MGLGRRQYVERAMHKSARVKVDRVVGPFGPLTAANLPSADTRQRWNVRRKAEVVVAVRGGLLSLEEACSRYALNSEEIRSWQHCIDQYGLKGLRTMHTQFYLGSGRAHSSRQLMPGHCNPPAQSIIRTGDLVVNLNTRSVEISGTGVHVTRKEYQLLELLSLRKGTTLTKDMILNHLYGGFDEPEQKVIDVFICKLRKKLADASCGKNYLETVWGRGYMLREPRKGKTVKRPQIHSLSGDASASHLRTSAAP
jgi:DNA-binding winged helix-turn-helix (wHTH) protein